MAYSDELIYLKVGSVQDRFHNVNKSIIQTTKECVWGPLDSCYPKLYTKIDQYNAWHGESSNNNNNLHNQRTIAILVESSIPWRRHNRSVSLKDTNFTSKENNEGLIKLIKLRNSNWMLIFVSYSAWFFPLICIFSGAATYPNL